MWILGFMVGLGVGMAVMSVITNIIVDRDHREWMKICDKYERLVESLLEELK